MSDAQPDWSLDSLMHWFKPHESWQDFFASAYAQALESTTAAEQLDGWRTAAMILGDMNACVLCLFVCYYGSSLTSREDNMFLGHIDLCLRAMGLASPVQPGPVPVKALGQPGAFRRDVEAMDAWMSEQLQPFAGDLRSAAEFSMRLTAIRLGLLDGPVEPSIAEVVDPTLWKRRELAANGASSLDTIRK